MLNPTVTNFPPTFNIPRFMADLLDEPAPLDPSRIATLIRIADAATADRLFAPFMQLVREGDAETFAPELAHSETFACLDVECRRERCVALQERILKAYPNGFTVCHVCRQAIANSARLQCGACAC